MKKLSKPFNSRRQTVESMTVEACYYACSCSCSGSTCGCNTISDYAGLSGNYSSVATSGLSSQPGTFSNYLVQFDGIV